MRPLAIIGNGITRDEAPHNNMDYDVWAMNNHPFLWQKRITALFEMHPDALTTNRYADDYKEWLRQKHDFPIFMHELNPDIPNCVKYPLNDIMQFHGEICQKGSRSIDSFFAESSTYMFALALHLGYPQIELYGIDLNKIEEKRRRDSVFFWLGILRANKIKIVIPAKSPLLDDALYPFR
jgi:hypothetical protein